MVITWKKQSAFTMIEIMVVLAVIGVIMAFFVPQMGKYLGKAKVKGANIKLAALKADLEEYNVDHGRYPTTAEGLSAVIDNEKELRDPWGNEFEYNAPPVRFKDKYKHYEIISLGKDGEESADDLDVGS